MDRLDSSATISTLPPCPFFKTYIIYDICLNKNNPQQIVLLNNYGRKNLTQATFAKALQASQSAVARGGHNKFSTQSYRNGGFKSVLSRLNP